MAGAPGKNSIGTRLAAGAHHRRVLVLGDDDRSFLSVIRSLGRKGIEVHTGWCPPGAPSLASRFIRENHIIHSFAQGDETWKKDLAHILKSKPFDLVIPCTDQTAIPLRSAKEELSSLTRLYLLPDDVHETVSDKSRTTALARSLGIPVPRETGIGSVEDSVNAAAELGFPLVLKPISSFSETHLSYKNRVRIANGPAELGDIVETMLLRGKIIAQEYLPGYGTGVEVLADSGMILFAFQHERIHEPLRGGGSSYRKSVQLHPGMLEAARRIIAALKYTGVAMIEFRRSRDSGEWRLLEINGRFWGSLPLALASRADFPWYLYQMLVEGVHDFSGQYKVGIFCRNLVSDLSWNVANIRGGKSGEALNKLPLRSVAGEIKNLIALRERSDTFVHDDIKPGFVQIGGLIRKILSSSAGPPSHVSETRLEMLKDALIRSNRILFVCKGNICRSPFAAAVARRSLPDTVEAASSGYLDPPGRRSPPEALRAASEMGIDLSGHRSRVIDEDIVADSDLILAFDRKTFRMIRNRFRRARSRLFLVGQLADPPSDEIIDPYGMNLSAFRSVYRQIEEIVEKIAGMMVS